MLKYKRKMCVNDKQKSSAFADHYASVSKLELTKGEKLLRNENVRVLKAEQMNCNITEEEQDLTIEERYTAISQMDDTKKAGNDAIEPPMISQLPLLKSSKQADRVIQIDQSDILPG